MLTSGRDRLYGAYVSSGQASPRATRSDAETVTAMFEPYAPHVNRFIRRHIPVDRDARILDLGCGDGMLLYFLDKAGYRNTLGVDISPEQIARARRLGVTRLQQGDINEVLESSRSASLDVTLLMDVLEHLTRDELLRTLDGVMRVLRTGGICLAHVPNAEGLHGMRIRYGDFTHEQAFTARSSAQIFRTVGFNEVRCYEDPPVVHGPTSLLRRVLWEVGTLPNRLLLAAETGERRFILTQTLLVKAVK